MKWLLRIIYLTVLGGLGFWAGRARWTEGPWPQPAPHGEHQGAAPAKTGLNAFPWQDRALGSDALLAFCAEQVSLAEIPAMLATLGPYADPTVLAALFRRWTEADPAAAVAYFEKFPLKDANRKLIGNTIMETWSGQDAKAAAAYALGEIDHASSRFDWNMLWKTLAHADGAAAFQKGLHGLTEMGEIFHEWVQQDLPAATAALEKLPPGGRLEQAALAVLDQQVKQDPSAALTWLRGLPDSIRAAIGMNALLGRYQDAPPAVKFSMLGEQLLGFGHTDDVSTQLRALRKLEADDPKQGEGYTKLFQSIDGHIGTDLREWASKDAPGALAWAAQFPDPNLRPVLAGEFAQELIHGGQVTTGLNALQGLPESAQVDIITRAAKDAQPGLAEQFPAGALRDAFLKGAARR